MDSLQTAAPSDEQIAILRRQLLKKGAEINSKLVDILNGKQVSVSEPLKPGETKEERLRRFLALVDSQLVAIRNHTYGKCVTCGDGLPFAQLEQVPWIDTCQKCAQPE
jgi:RNA polymerase-binding transcription factor DksA